MTQSEIDILMKRYISEESSPPVSLIETHISWVILGHKYAFKIKKPIDYSFLDFSSLEKRKFYCLREVELNQRFEPDVYIDVWPVRKTSFSFEFGAGEGVIVDYAVRMKRLNNDRQMDILIRKNEVTTGNIQALALRIANFHKSAEIVNESDVFSIQHKFNDLLKEKKFLEKKLGADCNLWITNAISATNEFINKHKNLLNERLQAGFLRDCHGDLHTRNIFLLPRPVIFDCIEFNDEYRQIDVLNEVAFLCMDLDAFNRHDLSDFFIHTYNEFFRTLKTEADHKLFMYYKCYRANVRAKVNSLRAESAPTQELQKQSLTEVQRYLQLMGSYVPYFSDAGSIE